MSDPARSGYFCHGRMVEVRVPWLTKDTGPAAYFCRRCGVWRHAFSPQETQLRALVETHMAGVLVAIKVEQE